MKQTYFEAFVVEERGEQFRGAVKSKSINDLPPGDLLIQVHYSSLNYKDALSASGNRGVTKSYPHTPGIDAAGVVVHSENDTFMENDKVIVTGYDLGMNTPGGFGRYIRVPSSWAVRLPGGLTMKEAMILGTAGFTAGLCVHKLTSSVTPRQGPIIVSGATGGVGSLSAAILASLGYHVTAVTGKDNERAFLQSLGVSEIIRRDEYGALNARPMLKGLFAGAIDTVGGIILENTIKSCMPLGVVVCCGNIASATLNLSIYPFILRGISLIGVSSQNLPMEPRALIWQKLAEDWKPKQLMNIYSEITLEGLNEKIEQILLGKLKGRTVVNLIR